MPWTIAPVSLSPCKEDKLRLSPFLGTFTYLPPTLLLSSRLLIKGDDYKLGGELSEAVVKPTALGRTALLGGSQSSCTHVYTPVARRLAPCSPGARDGFTTASKRKRRSYGWSACQRTGVEVKRGKLSGLSWQFYKAWLPELATGTCLLTTFLSTGS